MELERKVEKKDSRSRKRQLLFYKRITFLVSVKVKESNAFEDRDDIINDSDYEQPPSSNEDGDSSI